MKSENQEGIKSAKGIKGPQATRNKKLKDEMDEAPICHESLETWVRSLCDLQTIRSRLQMPGNQVFKWLFLGKPGAARLTSAPLSPSASWENKEGQAFPSLISCALHSRQPPRALGSPRVSIARKVSNALTPYSTSAF